MDTETRARLVSINHEFYQSMADSFSATRQRLQSGVIRILDGLAPDTAVLDLGCGNGGVAEALALRRHKGQYIGLDFSVPLLKTARARDLAGLAAVFYQSDFTSAGWSRPLEGRTFGAVLAFALLHHLPGDRERKRFLIETARHTAPGGRLILSNWQFLNSPRLQARVQPWRSTGLDEADVEPGDFLLDWRRDGYSLRYVHHFSESELQDLAARSGYRVLESFNSDGTEGNLGLYQIWARP